MSRSGILFYSVTLISFILSSNYSAKSEDAAGSNYGDGSTVPPPTTTACNNCTICQYPCHAQPPPPPPPPSADQGNCPPTAPVVCCGSGGQYYAPPAPFYYPYNNYSGAAATRGLSINLSYSVTLPFTFSFYYVLLFICY